MDSNVPIRIRAQFTPLGAGILGSAGPVAVASDFPNAPLPGTQYHIALANKLAGGDLAPALDDINANFTTAINFYLGLDNNHGAQNDLVTVLLHEFAHGLGFSQFANLTTGALFGGLPDVYNSHLFDIEVQKSWLAMTDAERLASATRFGKVVWTGGFVTAGVPERPVVRQPEGRNRHTRNDFRAASVRSRGVRTEDRQPERVGGASWQLWMLLNRLFPAQPYPARQRTAVRLFRMRQQLPERSC